MMHVNWFKTTWRNIQHNKSFAIINLIGLTAGFTGAMLIFCLLYYHLSFDNFHRDKDRIFRIVSMTIEGKEDYSQGIPQWKKYFLIFSPKMRQPVVTGNGSGLEGSVSCILLVI